MSRVQSSLPSKSKPFKKPVPVITQTLRPSVTGEGEDMFCFCSRWLPPLRRRFQAGTPVVRSTDHRNRSLPSATFRKTRSSQTIAVDPDEAGSASLHAILSVFDQRTGRLVSPLVPLADGPRHAGQFSARANDAEHMKQASSAALATRI